MGETRSVLITGCSSGIGLACVQMLAARGWRVVASARQAEDVERLRTAGHSAVRLNIADPESIGAALNETYSLTGGRLDALVNNAGIAIAGAVEDLSREVLQRQFDTNLFGTLELTNSVLPLMRRQGHGRIVMVSSILGRVAMPWPGANNASAVRPGRHHRHLAPRTARQWHPRRVGEPRPGEEPFPRQFPLELRCLGGDRRQPAPGDL